MYEFLGITLVLRYATDRQRHGDDGGGRLWPSVQTSSLDDAPLARALRYFS